MDLLQGVKSIRSQNENGISGVTATSESASGESETLDPEELFPGFGKAMDDLDNHISMLSAEDSTFEKYTTALSALRTCFATAFERRPEVAGGGGGGGTKTQSPMIFAWMYRIDESFQQALQERRPMALVILAHYMVLFARLEDMWIVEGWAGHIMEAVRRDVHPAYARWLEWPDSQL